ncbi:MAG: AAA family ATPase, partial [Deltaproteobacteria bacterium]|nr:AAA family ATPase [Deltaproteobacteria bacterium]
QHVLLIDLDPQANASSGLGVDSELLEASMYDLLVDTRAAPGAITDIVRQVTPTLDLAPATVALCAVEQLLAGQDERELCLKKHLESVAHLYDYIIIDCPPSLGLLTFNALVAARELIIPFETSCYAYQGVEKLLETVALLKDELGHRLEYHILPSMIDAKTRFARELLRKINADYPGHVLTTCIHQAIKLKEAAAKGKPITRYRSRKSRAFQDFHNLACEIQNLNMLSIMKQRKLDFDTHRFPLQMTSGIYFALQDAHASEVHLVGDFNNWKVGEDSRLVSDGFGGWRKFVPLVAGTSYRYKYFIDGEWLPDSNNPHHEPSPYGGHDSVITVEQPQG